MPDSGPKPASFNFEKTLKTSQSRFMQKVSLVDNLLNRPLAALIVRLVAPTRITPNQLTAIATLLGLIAAILFSRGNHLYVLLGGCCAQLSSIIDGADGMLARLRNTMNPFGAYLDVILDRVVDFILFLGIASGARLTHANQRLLLLGVLAAGIYMLMLNIFYLTRGFLQRNQTGETGSIRAILYWVILISAVFNRMDLFIYSGLVLIIIDVLVQLVLFLRLGKRKSG